jgi:hypothetical protein
MCPDTCGRADGGAFDNETAKANATEGSLCAELASVSFSLRASFCESSGDLCPIVCAGQSSAAKPGGGGRPASGSGGAPQSGSGAAGAAPPIATTCATLIELEGGCAHDLSAHDPGVAPGTKVSEVCPAECSGHGGCAPMAVDVSFLGTHEDSSGHNVPVELAGAACVDGSGVLFGPGQGDRDRRDGGRVRLGVGLEHAEQGGRFALSLWLLKSAISELWLPGDPSLEARDLQAFTMLPAREFVYHHPAAQYGGDQVQVYLVRTDWLDHYNLHVNLGLPTSPVFQLSLHRDEVPQWTHLTLTVDRGTVLLYVDGVELVSTADEANPVCSRQPCKDMVDGSTGRGWLNPTQGNPPIPGVCAERDSEPNWQCTNNATWPEARDTCERIGARLCTSVELAAGSGRGTGCSHTNRMIWSSSTNAPPREGKWERLECGAGEYAVVSGRGENDDALPPACESTGGSAAGWNRDGDGTVAEPYNSEADLTLDGCKRRCEDGTWAGCQGFSRYTSDSGQVQFETLDTEPGECWWVSDPALFLDDDPTDNEALFTLPLGATAVGCCADTVERSCTHQRSTEAEFRGAGLAPAAHIGAAGQDGADVLSGSVAMFQLYSDALDLATVACIFDSGKQLVRSGRMVVTDSICQSAVATGCTSWVASNGPQRLGGAARETNDDNSCTFASSTESSEPEMGIVPVSDAWQTVELQGVYRKPVVICGPLTRSSTAQAVLRIGLVQMDASGTWSFAIRAQQKNCRINMVPLPLAESATFMVVEAGQGSLGGWQAGASMAKDKEWHRASFYEPIRNPVVLNTVQNYEERAGLVSVRQYVSPGELHSSFFFAADSDGVWCPDSEWSAEYFDTDALTGSPSLVRCEPDRPAWHWPSGAPETVIGAAVSAPFSARWTTRVSAPSELSIVFTTLASGGSRVFLDDVPVLDEWESSCGHSACASKQLPVGAGSHIIRFECRSAASDDAVATTSHAVLAWTSSEEFDVGQNSEPLFADVGWFAVSNGASLFETGFSASEGGDLAVDLVFTGPFAAPPLVFAALQSSSAIDSRGNLRLVENSDGAAILQVERLDSCDALRFLTTVGDRSFAWVALSASSNDALANARVHQEATFSNDVAAVLAMAGELRLPAYMRWTAGTDPCVSV